MKDFTRHYKIAAFFFLLTGLTSLGFKSQAQLPANYTLKSYVEKIPILSNPVLLLGGGGVAGPTDDTIFSNQSIGFQFLFNGVNYSQVGISSNGFIWFGDSLLLSNEYIPIS